MFRATTAVTALCETGSGSLSKRSPMGEGKALKRLNSQGTAEAAHKEEGSVMYGGPHGLGSGAHPNRVGIQPHAKSHLRTKSTGPATEQGLFILESSSSTNDFGVRMDCRLT